ncbi:ABC transporter substrate-binding protein [Alkaliphilus peptidifermentans]|uniref:NitT/TauT family transport system substrate-binding protein n=1 Tax=Alkaliphilus peptidifermentans DSM 18978 TaxID=1120976 RepID=A0A1G5I2F6_9FIRM|nr:ABC transporter substrate-binding protein [Alkaliphilus peptidifermentans]SCY69548.1 NitT/TauT family transport system substrate-binding protein [Alkaliphilus peptidifermentans DSM 18978]
MKKLKLLSIVVVLLLLFSLVLTGCKKDDGLTSIKVMEVTHSVFYAPQYVAITEGFFKDEGLDVELIDGKGADKVMAALLSDQVDIGFMGPEASIYVYNQGKDDYAINFLQLTQRDGSFIVSRTPNLSFTFEELRGKEILGGRKGGMPNMVLEYVLKENNLIPGQDLNVRTDIQFGVMAGAFTGGEGDYTTLFEPTASMVEKEGKGYVVASVGEESGYIPYTAYSVKQSYVDKNPETIQKFTNAIYRGMLWVESHSAEEVAKSLQPHFPDTDLDILITVVERYRSIGAWAPNPVLTEEGLERLQDVMIEAGELSQKVDYNAIVNTEFAKKAIESIK